MALYIKPFSFSCCTFVLKLNINQKHKIMEKLREVIIEITTNNSKEQVWDLLFNRFGEVNVFNPIIEGSHHTTGTPGEVGCERQCDIDSKNSVHEKIVAARGNDSFDIDIIKGGLPMMKTMKGTFDLEAIDAERTLVQFTMRFNTKPAFMSLLMKGMMGKMLFKMLVGMKYHLETGNLVTKENIKEIMKDYKQLGNNAAFSDNLEVAYAS